MNRHLPTLLRRALPLCALLLALFACRQPVKPLKPETGQLAWPEITRETKPWTRWWWPASAVGRSDIDTMLDQYAEAGLGGMEVTTIYGAKGYEDRFLDYRKEFYERYDLTRNF